ncbi:MAG: prepilin-type N-terminal cleavage/methylation domain-containing protein, partial [bacterium]|nr:prepilin-type N-terminal cleavage/methylation domain-containing protein [bacterium]
MNSQPPTASKIKRGFTLIELLIYVALVSLFLTAATTALWDVILGNVKSSVQQEVQESLRYSSYRTQFELRNADSVNLGSSSFGVNLATNPSAKLSLSVPAPNNPVEFRVSGGFLQVNRGGAGWGNLTSNAVEVTNLTFTNLSDSESESVRFIITIRYLNPGNRSQWDKEATF